MAIDLDELRELVLADMRSTCIETTIDYAMNPRNAGSKHLEEDNQRLSSLQKRPLEEGLQDTLREWLSFPLNPNKLLTTCHF